MALISQLSFTTCPRTQLSVPSQVKALASRLSYHALTLILFTGNDFKTTILPMVCLAHRQSQILGLNIYVGRVRHRGRPTRFRK